MKTSLLLITWSLSRATDEGAEPFRDIRSPSALAERHTSYYPSLDFQLLLRTVDGSRVFLRDQPALPLPFAACYQATCSHHCLGHSDKVNSYSDDCSSTSIIAMPADKVTAQCSVPMYVVKYCHRVMSTAMIGCSRVHVRLEVGE